MCPESHLFHIAFIISPMDKGGKIYEPSRKLRSLTLPDMEPMTYGLTYLWNLHDLDAEKAEVHTMTIGAARPADLDNCIIACQQNDQAGFLDKVKSVRSRLDQALVDSLGKEWVETCYQVRMPVRHCSGIAYHSYQLYPKGICKSDKSKYMVEHTQVIWLYNCIQAWGLYEFAKIRYSTLVNNSKKYDPTLSIDENIDKMGRPMYGFMPGLAPDLSRDYFVDDLVGVPESNRAKFIEIYAFMDKWCKAKEPVKPGEKAPSEDKPPVEWQKGLEMKPWKDFPDRPYP